MLRFVCFVRNGSIIVDATLTLDEDALANLTGSNASSANIANYVGVALSNIPTSNSSLLANAEVKSITYSTAVETRKDLFAFVTLLPLVNERYF